MIRVTHLGKFYPPASGGIETHLQTLARSQSTLGADVRVLCVNHADETGADVTWGAFRRTPCVDDWDGPVRVTRLGRLASVARLELCPGLLSRLHEAQRGADVLHLHTPNPTMLLGLAAVGLRVPLVITHHSDIVRQRVLRHALAPFERSVYRQAARIIATSPVYPAGSRLLKRFREKVTAVPLGIDLDPYLNPGPTITAHARRLREAHGEPLWLMVGRLIYYKGLHVALRALAALPGKLLVIGSGPLARRMQDVARRLGVQERVVWRGYAAPEEVAGAYRAATALWFPSTARSEAFGLSQVEAMASGCPVINTAIPDSGVPWVSRDGETGLTAAVDDPESFAAAARRLLAEAQLREELGRRGRERARAEFSEGVMAERSLNVYRMAGVGGLCASYT